MTSFQKKLLDMSDAEVFCSIARLLGDLSDISNATGKSFNVTVAPDRHPILVINGELSDDIQFEEIPGFEGTMEQLMAL